MSITLWSEISFKVIEDLGGRFVLDTDFQIGKVQFRDGEVRHASFEADDFRRLKTTDGWIKAAVCYPVFDDNFNLHPFGMKSNGATVQLMIHPDYLWLSDTPRRFGLSEAQSHYQQYQQIISQNPKTKPKSVSRSRWPAVAALVAVGVAGGLYAHNKYPHSLSSLFGDMAGRTTKPVRAVTKDYVFLQTTTDNTATRIILLQPGETVTVIESKSPTPGWKRIEVDKAESLSDHKPIRNVLGYAPDSKLSVLAH